MADLMEIAKLAHECLCAFEWKGMLMLSVSDVIR